MKTAFDRYLDIQMQDQDFVNEYAKARAEIDLLQELYSPYEFFQDRSKSIKVNIYSYHNVYYICIGSLFSIRCTNLSDVCTRAHMIMSDCVAVGYYVTLAIDL